MCHRLCSPYLVLVQLWAHLRKFLKVPFSCHECSLNLPQTMANTTDIILGNNLIEIAALTTLFGSNIVETLVLGERGSAGLVWGITSAFGAPSVIKACISGASSGWLRSLLGLRTIASDQAIGLDLKLSPKSNREIKVRRTFNDVPLGVSCDAEALQVEFLSILSSHQLPMNYRRCMVDPCRGSTPHVKTSMPLTVRPCRSSRGSRRPFVVIHSPSTKVLHTHFSVSAP